MFQNSFGFVFHCANSYSSLGRISDAIAALETYPREGEEWIEARLMLVTIYQRSRQYQEMVSQYIAIIDQVEEPAGKSLYKGEMLLAVYPEDPEQLELARKLFQQALVLDPSLKSARNRIEQIDKKLARIKAN